MPRKMLQPSKHSARSAVRSLNAIPLVAPEDDGQVAPELLYRIIDSLSLRDQQLLERLERIDRLDLEQLEGYASSDLLWLAYYNLVAVDVDPADRVFITKTPYGKVALDGVRNRGNEVPIRERIRRRRRRGPVAVR
jgi:hypothetical protein